MTTFEQILLVVIPLITFIWGVYYGMWLMYKRHPELRFAEAAMAKVRSK
jgi:hypothetical protein